jgi:transketolase
MKNLDFNHLLAPRDTIGETLVELGRDKPELVVVDCDLGKSTRLLPFEKTFPERFIQLGSQENNALSLVTGLATAGLTPVYVCFTMFSIGLPWTQIRMAAYGKVPFTIIGTHPGFDIGPDGGTHQMMEDLALARSIPGLEVHSPSDLFETKSAMKLLIGNDKLNYIRVGRHPVPLWYDESVCFTPGKADVWLDKGRDVVLFADGSMIFNAYQAGLELLRDDLGVMVVNARSVKPLDEALLKTLAQEARLIVSVENHSVLGGLGGAVAEIVSAYGGRLLRIGSPDVFGESASTDELRHKYGMDVEGILKSVRNKLRENL